MMNKVRKALSIGGPTFIHSLDPCPKGWDYDPMLSHELGELAVETGIFPLYEVEDGVVRHYGKSKAIAEGRPRKPVREYLLKQGRFAHFIEEDLDYFQAKVDEMWEQVGDSRRRSVLEGEAPGGACSVADPVGRARRRTGLAPPFPATEPPPAPRCLFGS